MQTMSRNSGYPDSDSQTNLTQFFPESTFHDLETEDLGSTASEDELQGHTIQGPFKDPAQALSLDPANPISSDFGKHEFEGLDFEGDLQLGDLDDDQLEAEEEQAIRAELRDREGKPETNNKLPGPVSLEKLNNQSSDSSSEALSDSSSWGGEAIEDYFNLKPQSTNEFNPNDFKHHDDPNEFGFEYDRQSDLEPQFWGGSDGSSDSDLSSLDESQDTETESMVNVNNKDKSKSTFTSFMGSQSSDNDPDNEDLPMLGRGPLPVVNHSGDSTDEDDGVPEERKRRRAKGSKAIEVLGSNSMSTRPPVLGSWEIDQRKNIGIIDGLTTSTLSPPEQKRSSSNDQDDPFTSFHESDNSAAVEEDEIDENEIELDLRDYITEISGDEDLNEDVDDQTFTFDLTLNNQLKHRPSESSPYIYKPRIDNKIDHMAFRNKNMAFGGDQSMLNDDNLSPMPKKRRPIRKQVRKRRKSRSSQFDNINFMNQDDFINELIDIGAISPIFETT